MLGLMYINATARILAWATMNVQKAALGWPVVNAYLVITVVLMESA